MRCAERSREPLRGASAALGATSSAPSPTFRGHPCSRSNLFTPTIGEGWGRAAFHFLIGKAEKWQRRRAEGSDIHRRRASEPRTHEGSMRDPFFSLFVAVEPSAQTPQNWEGWKGASRSKGQKQSETTRAPPHTQHPSPIVQCKQKQQQQQNQAHPLELVEKMEGLTESTSSRHPPPDRDEAERKQRGSGLIQLRGETYLSLSFCQTKRRAHPAAPLLYLHKGDCLPTIPAAPSRALYSPRTRMFLNCHGSVSSMSSGKNDERALSGVQSV